MPYIKKEDRERLAPGGHWNGSAIKTAGELNYLITILVLQNSWRTVDDLTDAIGTRIHSLFDTTEKKYQNHNDIIGAVVGALFEFRRRFRATHPRQEDLYRASNMALEKFYFDVTAPYEDLKIVENGDVVTTEEIKP